MFFEPKTLVVVYKDELMLNFLRKLVETNDDISEENPVGVPDGSVRIVAWNEKVWRDQKKAGNINNKVLFLGNIKGIDHLMPIIDVKYNEYGIQYGWAGNQAVVFVDSKALKNEGYQDFFKLFCELPVPESLKVNEMEKPIKNHSDKKRSLKTVAGAAIGFATGLPGMAAAGTAIGFSSDIDAKIQQQQYIFGIFKLYENHLDKFINN